MVGVRQDGEKLSKIPLPLIRAYLVPYRLPMSASFELQGRKYSFPSVKFLSTLVLSPLAAASTAFYTPLEFRARSFAGGHK
jgi:hypothetical protein